MSIPNDPLAGLTRKQVWIECVIHSTECAGMKLFLLIVGRFFDAEGRASSMSLGQIARNCSLHADTIRTYAKRAREYWLVIEVQNGFWTKYGRQNMYHAAFPPKVLEGLRQERAQQQAWATHQERQGGGRGPRGRGGSSTPPNIERNSNLPVWQEDKYSNLNRGSPYPPDPLASATHANGRVA